ncbi:HAD family hydrolase [Nocardia testacea]|uniref:HAD family hydrolase n=1 Tax=Nocardia testacea TaxID=248551 RepID=A0ABW7W0F7_9NOCA
MNPDLFSRRYLLLDFDGPICAVFAGLTDRTAAVELCHSLMAPVPQEVASSKDPFDVLRYAAQVSPAEANIANREFTKIECRAVESARPTHAADQLITEAAGSGHLIAIVSNNSTEAINAYLRMQNLTDFVAGVYARTDGNVSLLKPSPYLLQAAMTSLGSSATECVFVGDSVTDIQAGNAAGVPTIGYANRPEKAERFAPHGPAAIITTMDDALTALRASRPIG